MSHRIAIRSIISGFILSILLTLAFGTTIGYLLFTVGSQGLRETRQVSTARGAEIALALAEMSADRGTEDPGVFAVRLSSVMDKIVTVSEAYFNDFQVNSIFLVSADGRLQAHNEVALLARDETNPFNGADFERTLKISRKQLDEELDRLLRLTRFDRDAYLVRELESRPTNIVPFFQAIKSTFPRYAGKLEAWFPETVVTRYHIGVPVFAQDEDLAAGAVHMFITVRSTNDYVAALRKYSMQTLAMAAGFVFFITTLMVLVMMLAFRGGDAGVDTATRARRQAVAVLEESPPSAGGDLLAGERAPVPVPIEETRRRAHPLPDPELDVVPFDNGRGAANQTIAPLESTPLSEERVEVVFDSAGPGDAYADDAPAEALPEVAPPPVEPAHRPLATPEPVADPIPTATIPPGAMPRRVMDAIPLENIAAKNPRSARS